MLTCFTGKVLWYRTAADSEYHAAVGLPLTAIPFPDGPDGTRRMPGCATFVAQEVMLEQVRGEGGPPILVEADGDLQGQLPASIKVLRGAIHFLA